MLQLQVPIIAVCLWAGHENIVYNYLLNIFFHSCPDFELAKLPWKLLGVWEIISCQQFIGCIYNITMWFWAGTGIKLFHSSGLNQAAYAHAQCEVISCVTNARACHHTLNANQWHGEREIAAITDVKGNITTFIYVCRFIENLFYRGRIPFNGSKQG